MIVVIDRLFPNFIFTTMLDVDYNSTYQRSYYENKYKIKQGRVSGSYEEDNYDNEGEDDENQNEARARAKSPSNVHKKPNLPPYVEELKMRKQEIHQQSQVRDNNSHKSRSRSSSTSNRNNYSTGIIKQEDTLQQPPQPSTMSTTATTATTTTTGDKRLANNSSEVFSIGGGSANDELDDFKKLAHANQSGGLRASVPKQTIRL